MNFSPAVKPFGWIFEAGTCIYAATSGSKIWPGCSTRSFGAGSNITGGSTARRFIHRCVNWAVAGPLGLSKYKKLRGHLRRATHWVARISRRDPKLWAHWQMGVRRGSMAGAV